MPKDNIPQLERRIEASENKLQQLRQKLQGTVKPGESEKVESSIISDKESIVQQHARGGAHQGVYTGRDSFFPAKPVCGKQTTSGLESRESQVCGNAG